MSNPMAAIENLTATTLRNIIGDLELDQTLTSRETINTKMRAELDLATDPWGIKVNRVELKNIIPPAAIRDAMEKQMKAERERREDVYKRQGLDCSLGKESYMCLVVWTALGILFYLYSVSKAKERWAGKNETEETLE